MRIIRIDPKRPSTRAIKMAVTVLKRGGLVVYPTETAYALGCDAANASAMRRVYAVKGREKGKPLPLIAASLAQARHAVAFDKYSLLLAKNYWPSPLTLVLHAHPSLLTVVSKVGFDIALRVSPHLMAAALTRALGRPVVSTSANRSGAATKYDVASVLADLGTLPDLVLDAGRLEKRRPSTVVRCDARGPARRSLGVGGCEILRPGPISARAIRDTLRSCD